MLTTIFSSLRSTSTYSDLTIYCCRDTHKVHKAVVCGRSGVLTGACRIGEVTLSRRFAFGGRAQGLMDDARRNPSRTRSTCRRTTRGSSS